VDLEPQPLSDGSWSWTARFRGLIRLKYSASSSNPVALDFDIEGDANANPTRSDGVNSVTLRNQAIAALQKADPGLKVSFTLPVNETGFDSSEIGVLQNAVSNGVALSVVNIMTMDFGEAIASGQFGSVVTTAANDTLSQMSAISARDYDVDRHER